jgi:hypothetical protein
MMWRTVEDVVKNSQYAEVFVCRSEVMVSRNCLESFVYRTLLTSTRSWIQQEGNSSRWRPVADEPRSDTKCCGGSLNETKHCLPAVWWRRQDVGWNWENIRSEGGGFRSEAVRSGGQLACNSWNESLRISFSSWSCCKVAIIWLRGSQESHIVIWKVNKLSRNCHGASIETEGGTTKIKGEMTEEMWTIASKWLSQNYHETSVETERRDNRDQGRDDRRDVNNSKQVTITELSRNKHRNRA